MGKASARIININAAYLHYNFILQLQTRERQLTVNLSLKSQCS